jgi:hypothetical protein
VKVSVRVEPCSAEDIGREHLHKKRLGHTARILHVQVTTNYSTAAASGSCSAADFAADFARRPICHSSLAHLISCAAGVAAGGSLHHPLSTGPMDHPVCNLPGYCGTCCRICCGVICPSQTQGQAVQGSCWEIRSLTLLAREGRRMIELSGSFGFGISRDLNLKQRLHDLRSCLVRYHDISATRFDFCHKCGFRDPVLHHTTQARHLFGTITHSKSAVVTTSRQVLYHMVCIRNKHRSCCCDEAQTEVHAARDGVACMAWSAAVAAK